MDKTINGTQLTRSRYAQSSKNHLNSYAYLQKQASKSKTGKVSSGFALHIDKAKTLIFIKQEVTPDFDFSRVILQEILDTEHFLKSYPRYDSPDDRKNLNILKWIFLNWNNPVINKPVLKDFPDVSSQWLDFIKTK